MAGESTAGGSAAGRPAAASTALRAAVGLVVAAALLWLLFRGTDWDALAAALRRLDPGWLIASVLAMFASHVTRVQRWTYIVRAVAPAPFRDLFAATQIGLLVNFTVPARVGEVVRGVVLARRIRLAVPRALAKVALDRVNDLIGLLAAVALAAAGLSAGARVELAPGAFGNADAIVVSAALVRATTLGLAAAAAAALIGLGVLYAARERFVRWTGALLSPFPDVWAERAASLLDHFAEGMRVFRSARDLAASVAWSLVTWGLNAASLAALAAAFGVAVPWWAPFLMLALIGVFIAVPVTPAVVGQYHVPAAVGLLVAAPDAAATTAKAFALVSHAVALLPIGALGVWALLRERVDLRDLLRRRSRNDVLPGAGTDRG